jgi:arylsulfatase A-like enzyme
MDKQVAASHWGGTRNGNDRPLAEGHTARGELRHQFHHVIDVAATILEVTGCPRRRGSTASRSSRCTHQHGLQLTTRRGERHGGPTYGQFAPAMWPRLSAGADARRWPRSRDSASFRPEHRG